MNPLNALGRHGRAALVVLTVLAVAAPAHALVINATFDSSITSQADAADIESTINNAIAILQMNVTNPITVSIDFKAMSGGLGQSDTSIYQETYYDYYNALKLNAKSPAQITALASLGAAPTSESSINPVDGTSHIWVTSANGRALGFNTPGSNGGFDSVVSFNTSITSPPNGLSGNYSLQAVALHEIDEVLGIGGSGSTLGQSLPGGGVGGLDLYRYSAPGTRSYSTAAASSYFSIDGGTTVLTNFNQNGQGDYADWATGSSPQVQDAFGTAGVNLTLGPNELTALNVVGYNLAPVPEPSSLALTGLGAAALVGLGRRRRRRRGAGPISPCS